MTLRKSVLLVLLGAFAALALPGCGDANKSLRNDANVLTAKWAAINRRLNYLERNAALARANCGAVERYLKEYPPSSAAPAYAVYADSVRAEYERFCAEFNALAASVQRMGYRYETAHKEFNTFYRKLADKDVTGQQAAERLKQYEKSYAQLEDKSRGLQEEFGRLVAGHNAEIDALAALSTHYLRLSAEKVYPQK